MLVWRLTELRKPLSIVGFEPKTHSGTKTICFVQTPFTVHNSKVGSSLIVEKCGCPKAQQARMQRQLEVIFLGLVRLTSVSTTKVALQRCLLLPRSYRLVLPFKLCGVCESKVSSVLFLFFTWCTAAVVRMESSVTKMSLNSTNSDHKCRIVSPSHVHHRAAAGGMS